MRIQSLSAKDVINFSMERASSQSRHGHSVPLLKIVIAWISALALASGHHAFYASLDNHPVTSGSGTTALLLVHSQAGASAIGTTFAFLVSSLLAVSAGTAFLQCAWRVVRTRAFSISGLNAMWSSPTNVFAFLSLDFWRTAQGVVVISGLAWAFPLIVTFAPGTLTVATDITTTSGQCSVPAFDWGATGLLYDVIDSASISYNSPSSLIQQIVGATFLAGQPLAATSPCGRNCSYVMSTNAPSYSCSVGAQNPSALNWTSADLNPEFSPPPYFAAQTDITAPSSENQFVKWDFQAHYTNYTSGLPVANGGHNITCIAYNSTYSVNYTFAGTTASVVIDKIVPQQLAGQMSPNISGQAGFLVPGSDPLVHTAWYNATASYYAILDSISAYTIGSVVPQNGLAGASVVYTPSTIQLGQTQLMQTSGTSRAALNFTWIPIKDIPPIFESLLQNITLSILTGAADRTQTTTTICSYSDNNTHFVYNERRLWLIYGLGLGVALLCDFFGIIALFQNSAFGGATSSYFGDFLAATRNPELNELNLNESGRVRLKYGPVLSEGGRFAFSRPDALAVGGKENSLLGSM
ncbi:hypothetical protein MSAN_00781100 [Mycena sanguinolenta]|uniref:Uncharacterized protein n=1 Tax=Mycena sanguinolenta TaxID=230812 RepID=A0A8H7DHC6_9AGAR|nr:hypothetical protein MSAN_00781100 [Mycena sanguinolenta]